MPVTDPHGYEADHLDLLAATTDIGLWQLNVIDGTAQRNLRHDEIFGYSEKLEEWSDEVFMSHVVPGDRERVKTLMQQAVDAGQPWSFETEIVDAYGRNRWIAAKGKPRFDAEGRITHLIGHVMDITAMRQREERLTLLTGELNHRVLNTISVIQAMVRMSSRTATDTAAFARELSGRLDALARSARLLSKVSHRQVYLSDVFNTEIAVFLKDPSRITITGDVDLPIEGRSAEAMTLVLHELLTNAMKHGALSREEGRITLSVERDDVRSLLIRWEERGGPPVSGPGRPGFGSTLIENALKGIGSATRHFDPDGLRVEIQLDRLAKIEDAVEAKTDQPQLAPRLLLVEDEAVIGMDLSMTLEEQGYLVDGPHPTVSAAMAALRVKPDLALIDVTLGKDNSAAVARKLRDQSVPFAIMSGMLNQDGLPEEFQGAPIMQKPHRDRDMLALLEKIHPAPTRRSRPRQS